MREIKFRGLAMHGNKWVYGLFFNSGSEGQWTEIQTESGATFYVESDTISQYTGLVDKNGKELYEHDITMDKYKNVSVCCWIKEVAAFGFVPIQIYPNKSWHALFEEQGEDTFFRNDKPAIYHEIIGNIYENPELLDGDSE
ncbi:YopX family protein [Oceanobacillus alkalisoli]|uniref:YopX family protein n=1 Tax=Oceanobacillus alkalisoli TaxID=2925113 RepID=UPI001EE4B6DB|nr:YopX family protein [Oceanobacillus alkalisoli]MCG5104418.1 YopX family protein [Oceanobacillus alkalisoli]